MRARPAKTPQTFPLGPPLDFLQHLWELNHALERMSLRMKRRLGVTAQQRLLVRCIGKYPGLTATQLATMLHLDRGTVSVGLRRLSREGLVTRDRDRRDQRRVALGLTAAGRRLDRPLELTVEAAVERLIAGVSANDLRRAKAVLRRLTESISQELTSEARTAPGRTSDRAIRARTSDPAEPVRSPRR